MFGLRTGEQNFPGSTWFLTHRRVIVNRILHPFTLPMIHKGF